MRKIAFAHLGDYYRAIKYLLEKTTDAQIIVPPKITKKTIELGNKYSPELICTPFKYNLGNFIESLDLGADTIIHIGGGCKFGYYAEVQERILKDLGYDFTFINLVPERDFSLKRVYKLLKSINPNLKLIPALHTGLYTMLTVFFKDKLDDLVRINKAIIQDKKRLNLIEKSINKKFYSEKSIFKLIFNYFKHKRMLKKLKKTSENGVLKIGIIGELYDNIESSSNLNLEDNLINMGVKIKRFTNATSLVFLDGKLKNTRLKFIKKYDKYDMGADATTNVYRIRWLKKHKYDGVIHVKPFGCTPEIGVISVLENISTDMNMPIMYITFDGNYTDVGLNTRLEAFYDMLKMRKDRK